MVIFLSCIGKENEESRDEGSIKTERGVSKQQVKRLLNSFLATVAKMERQHKHSMRDTKKRLKW